jgi:SAM-dependent methyltransferase
MLASIGALKNIDASALFGHNSMHVFDTATARKLIGEGHSSLLDVGAGAGEVTNQLRPLFKDVTATEASACCIHRLKQRGINCLHTCELEGHDELRPGSFSVVSLLNVLDRCSKPRELLRQAAKLVASDGKLLVGVVAPYEPFVVIGGGSTLLGRWFVSTSMLEEEDRLMAANAAHHADQPTATDPHGNPLDLVWENTVNHFAEGVFAHEGLAVRSVSRAPYVCQADESTGAPYYQMDMALFVLSPTELAICNGEE